MVKAQHLIFLCEESVSGVRLYLLPGLSGSVRDQTSEGVCVWEGVCVGGYVCGSGECVGVKCSPYKSAQTQP